MITVVIYQDLSLTHFHPSVLDNKFAIESKVDDSMRVDFFVLKTCISFPKNAVKDHKLKHILIITILKSFGNIFSSTIFVAVLGSLASIGFLRSFNKIYE
jgi:hypothetical protein